MPPKAPLLLAALVSGLIACDAAQSSEALFSEDFEGAYYTTDAPPAIGSGKLPLGEWGLNSRGDSLVTLSNACALSPERCLKLFARGEEARAQILAFPGHGEGKLPVSSALKAKFAFNLPDPDTSVTIVIRDSKDITLAHARIGGGALWGQFGHDARANTRIGSLQADTWYHLVFSMPGNPGSDDSPYKITLLAADGETELGTGTGSLSGETQVGFYSYLSIAVQGSEGFPDGAVGYFDDIAMTLDNTP